MIPADLRGWLRVGAVSGAQVLSCIYYGLFLLTVLPVLVAYAFSQRTFVRGAQTSGLKG